MAGWSFWLIVTILTVLAVTYPPSRLILWATFRHPLRDSVIVRDVTTGRWVVRVDPPSSS